MQMEDFFKKFFFFTLNKFVFFVFSFWGFHWISSHIQEDQYMMLKGLWLTVNTF